MFLGPSLTVEACLICSSCGARCTITNSFSPPRPAFFLECLLKKNKNSEPNHLNKWRVYLLGLGLFFFFILKQKEIFTKIILTQQLVDISVTC